MTKIKFVLTSCFLCVFVLQNAVCQSFTPYVQAEAGISTDNKNLLRFGIEFGKTYKWLDLGIGLDYEGTSLGDEYHVSANYVAGDDAFNDLNLDKEQFGNFANNSLQLIAKVDIIGLFTSDSRHLLKIGGGYGVLNRKSVSSYTSHNNDQTSYSLTVENRYGLTGSFKLSYEYKVLPGLRIGAFWGGAYSPFLGFLVRGNF
ncbi:MAG: hypothetical protein H6Q20_1373 [Bacteroidetes bacterium]|nr:hypothetical protein [Bacteroidota bacterium]